MTAGPGAGAQGAAGAALAARLARVPRQKVRLSRHRLLESAAKFFHLSKTATYILEVEFHGEAGTGKEGSVWGGLRVLLWTAPVALLSKLGTPW